MSTETDKEVIENQKKALAKIEEDLKNKSQEIEKRISSVEEMESKITAKNEELLKKLGISDTSSVFDSMVATVNSLYTSYYGIKVTDEGLMEAITSILNARKSLNT